MPTGRRARAGDTERGLTARPASRTIVERQKGGDRMQAPETQAPETQAPETQAPETHALVIFVWALAAIAIAGLIAAYVIIPG